MKDLRQFFAYMNDINFPYVVLRNWENLPDSIELGEHSDLDLLVYDLEHWKEIFSDAKRTYPEPRVQFKVDIGDSYILTDVRSLNDRYYPEHFSRQLLQFRQWNPRGFYIPDPGSFKIALAYHCVHHKGANIYPQWLGIATVDQLLEALKESIVGWTEPTDPSVGRFNSYWRGATAIVERYKDGKITKKQTGYMDRDLTANEWRILNQCLSTHFPIVYDSKTGSIEIEDCGDMLTITNLPDNWKEQLLEIVKDLRDFNIEHRDIQPNNLMVKKGIIRLIDFGWARFKSDVPDNPPNCLGYPYRSPWGPDDSFAMRKVIKEFEYQESEKEHDTNSSPIVKGSA
jgi:hypothetical protein